MCLVMERLFSLTFLKVRLLQIHFFDEQGEMGRENSDHLYKSKHVCGVSRIGSQLLKKSQIDVFGFVLGLVYSQT